MTAGNSYFLGNSNIPLITITGVCRSGKTLLGNLLATCEQVEYADEPHTAMLLPMAANTGMINEDFALGWLRANLSELFYELIILRKANFRKNDLSSIWSKKTSDEINNRLTNVNTRDDANKLALINNAHLLVTLSECIPFIEFINKAIPKTKFIHVIRNPFDVASAVLEKKWFSDAQLIKPINAQLYKSFNYMGTIWNLPWWIADEDHEYFIKLNEYERGVYYWCSLMEKGIDAFNNTSCEKLTIHYEDLVRNPKDEFNKVRDFLDFTNGPLSDSMISNVRVINSKKEEFSINHLLDKKAKGLYEKTLL